MLALKLEKEQKEKMLEVFKEKLSSFPIEIEFFSNFNLLPLKFLFLIISNLEKSLLK